MVNFYRNILHKKCKLSIFLVTAILCISSTQLLCSARPNPEISANSNITSNESISDVAEAIETLPGASPEYKKQLKNMIRRLELNQQKGNESHGETENINDEEEYGDYEDTGDQDYFNAVNTEPVLNYTELKTTPLPRKSTRTHAPAFKKLLSHNEEEDDEYDEDDTSIGHGDDEDELISSRTSSTTTEEPVPIRVVEETTIREDETTTGGDETTTLKMTPYVVNSSSVTKNLSLLSFVPVLYILG